MALRVRVPHVARRAGGAVPSPASSATMYVVYRNTLIEANLYTAETGGSLATQPVSPDVNGNYQYWVDRPGQFDIYETIDGVAFPKLSWEAAPAAIETWIAATFQNSWTNFGTGFSLAQYCKTTEGLVKVKGLIKSGTVGASAFTLPAGYRPLQQLVYGVVSNGGLGRVDVTTAGTVIPSAPSSNVWVALDGIIFRAEA